MLDTHTHKDRQTDRHTDMLHIDRHTCTQTPIVLPVILETRYSAL